MSIDELHVFPDTKFWIIVVIKNEVGGFFAVAFSIFVDYSSFRIELLQVSYILSIVFFQRFNILSEAALNIPFDTCLIYNPVRLRAGWIVSLIFHDPGEGRTSCKQICS